MANMESSLTLAGRAFAAAHDVISKYAPRLNRGVPGRRSGAAARHGLTLIDRMLNRPGAMEYPQPRGER